MAHVVLARKYRSQTFKDLIGQDVLVRTLMNAIEREKIAHGYIFTGIRGCGKTSSARIFAKSLNCLGEDGQNTKPVTTPCGVCENCVAITQGRHMDVVELDAASHTGVENMRSILEESAYRPVSARYKIYIIDEVHMLSNSAFNAMLKTLEEPPSHVIFILATTELHKVPVTILSRCQRFSLARISPEVLSKHYQFISDSEGLAIEPQALHLITHAADGSVRDGLSLLDQAISLSEDKKIKTDLVSEMLGKTNMDTVVSLFDAMIANNIKAVLKITQDFMMQGGSPKALLSDLLDFIYQLTQVKADAASVEDVTAVAKEQKDLRERANDFSYVLLARVWQLLLKGLEDLKNAPNPHSILDMACLRVAYLSQEVLPKTPGIPDGSTGGTPTKTPVESTPDSENRSQENTLATAEKAIETIHDVCRLLSDHKEVLLRDVLEKEARIEHCARGKLCLCAPGQNRDFTLRLSNFLKDKTGETWVIELIEESDGVTLEEENLAEVQKDEIVSEAMHLFDGAKIESISEE
ncbi:MAG: DNA polymerase III subunit gamma/tau [Alphaproteobacteria bacterium]|nr:DNA polymerase III subunit gamma/tau [Alphaproteobacteria bacterium]MBN2780055.1 DNA polymerase III subunit gamma/tau [Alphaproteobacteria bacterium]